MAEKEGMGLVKSETHVEGKLGEVVSRFLVKFDGTRDDISQG